MLKFVKAALAAAMIFSAVSIASPSTASATGTVNCAKLKVALNTYIALVKKLYGGKPKYAALLAALIADAKANYNKVCPSTPPFDPSTIYECEVLNTAGDAFVSLGLNSSSALDNSGSPAKVVCMSQVACTNIVSSKFFVNNIIASSRCSANPVPSTVQHLTDPEVQTKINAIP